MSMNLAQARGYDQVLTQIAQGYHDQGEYLGNFLAPVVPVHQRAGRYIKFGKEAFAAVDTLRAPMTSVGYVESSFTHGTFNLEQHALGYRIAEELESEAKNGESKIDLRKLYIDDMMSRFQRAHEVRTFGSMISTLDAATPDAFTAGTRNNTLVGNKLWNKATADPILDMLSIKQRVADVIGVEPNSGIIGSNVNVALAAYGTLPEKNNRFYGDPGRKNLLDMFGLKRGVKVASKQVLDSNGNLRYIFNPDAVLLFYSPVGSNTDSVLPSVSANMGAPSFGYTFQLKDYPKMTSERFNDEYRYYAAEIIAERKVKVTAPEAAVYFTATNGNLASFPGVVV